MGTEIERKYLLKDLSWKQGAEGILYSQGYLSTTRKRTVRVRTIGERGYLTIKSSPVKGVRPEYEYEIPFQDAREMLDIMCQRPIIEKVRYKIAYNGFIWEVDEFLHENSGLILAEIELEYSGQQYALPPWIGSEVTDDPRYCNSNLSRRPFSKWTDET